ncbi:Drug resistance protein [Venturia nashicola]|uniref:Drug resistance protein n=1 Tax=Venturia nashicola TaxID=86259 RepID=A0A4Z1PCM0_9PEZI|nr:Drug resistance protein [Venturia nashicola]
MHLNTRREYAFTAPCPYVPLSKYSWKSYDPDSPAGCGTLSWNPVVFSLLAAFQAGTILLAFEVIIQLFFQFKRKSLYFWSILISSCGGLLFSASGFVLQYDPNSAIYGSVLMNIAWIAMVTGFSFVLYSRLHFLNPRPLILRIVLAFIVIDALLFQVPVIVTTILNNADYNAITWKVYRITSFMEIAFTIQETIITTLYVYLFLLYTKDRRQEPETKKVMWQLFFAESVVFSTDIIMNVLLYTEYYLPRQIIQSFVSVLKLRIEFAVLNSLINYSQSKSSKQMELNWLDNSESTGNPNGLIAISQPASKCAGMGTRTKAIDWEEEMGSEGYNGRA